MTDNFSFEVLRSGFECGLMIGQLINGPVFKWDYIHLPAKPEILSPVEFAGPEPGAAAHTGQGVYN